MLEESEEERTWGRRAFLFFFFLLTAHPAPNLQFIRRAASPLCVDMFSPRGEIVRK